jgi:hypothetical protein
MERAFTFLKRTSVSCGAPGAGAGVTLEDKGGVVLAGEALGDAPPTGEALGGVSSCASDHRLSENNTKRKQSDRAIMVSIIAIYML